MSINNKEYVQQIVTSISNFLEIPACHVSYLKLDGDYQNVTGFFVKEKYLINVNLLVINRLSDLELAAFIIHEVRHAYQYVQVKELLPVKEDKEIINKWQDEIYSYCQPHADSNQYLQQTVEIDAIAFTAYFCKRFFQQNLIVPKEIEKDVKTRISEIELTYFDKNVV